MNIHTEKPASGEEMVLPKASLDDVQSDVWHLYHLLNVAVGKMYDMPFERDSKRDAELDEVSALFWIARDRAEFIAKYIDENFNVIRGWEKGVAK